MRALVYGPYPPTPGPDAAEALAVVRDLVSDGHDVVVVSPVPSAAHHHLDVGGASGAISLLRMSGSVDKAVIRLDATGLQADSDAPRLRPARLLLSRAMRRIGDVDLVLDRVPGQPSSGWVSTVAAAAASVVVASEQERDALAQAGVDRARIRLREEQLAGERPRGGRTESLPGWSGTTREALQRDVRRRAAALRAAGPGGGVAGRGPAASQLREIAPLALTPIESSKPGVVYVKRLIRRLVAWQLDPIIQHVNKLHRATVAAAEQLEGQPKTRSTSEMAADRNERSEA